LSIELKIGLTYCFADYNIMLGVYLPAPGIQIVVELGQVEKMAGFELVVPGFASAGLVPSAMPLPLWFSICQKKEVRALA
jgi:hypothetical protein